MALQNELEIKLEVEPANLRRLDKFPLIKKLKQRPKYAPKRRSTLILKNVSCARRLSRCVFVAVRRPKLATSLGLCSALWAINWRFHRNQKCQ